MRNFTTTPAGASDEEFLRTLFIDVRRDDFELNGLQPEQIGPLLSMQFAAQMRSYSAAYPQADHRIIRWSDEPVGRILVSKSPGAAHIVDISILRGFRGRGIGRALIEDLKSTAEVVSLNVFKGNVGAIRLYERCGFRFVSDDGVYYGMEFNNA